MVVRGKEFREIYDLVGLRVIVDSVKDCYAALGTLHAMWRPIPGRFKDYIAMRRRTPCSPAGAEMRRSRCRTSCSPMTAASQPNELSRWRSI
jgi:hypothetical protein